MKTEAEYIGAQRTLEGDLIICFAVEDENVIEKLEKDRGQRLTVEAKRYKEPRSLNANNYFWKLCELIAQKAGSTQDEIHDLMLYRYGVRADLRFNKAILPAMKSQFDIVLELGDYGDEVEARCFVGSRFYDTAEMARLIDGTVSDAKDYGVDLLNPEEIERLVSEWEGAKHG